MTSPAAVEPDLVRRLFATPPPEFVAARNALAKQLRAAKNRDAAATVAAWRRPGWADWALDVTAADHPDDVAVYAKAAADVRAAQAAAVEGRDGPDVRDALRALRAAVAQLARHAGDVLAGAGRDPDVAEVTARLAEVAANPAAVEQLRDGVLGAGDPDDVDLFAGLRPPARSRRAPARAARATGEGAVEDDTADDTGDGTAAAELAERRRRLERELEEAEEAQRVAAGELGDADGDLDAAEAAVRDAAGALARAETHRDDVRARRAAAADALAAAEAAVEAQRDALAELTRAE